MTESELALSEVGATCAAGLIKSALHEHYSDRDGLDSCPCSYDVSADETECDCGAAQANAKLRRAVEIVEAIAGVCRCIEKLKRGF